MNSISDDDLAPVQLLDYGIEGADGGYDNEVADNEGSLSCSSNEQVLTNGALSTLQREVPFSSQPENYGIVSFIKAKTIIKVHHAE